MKKILLVTALSLSRCFAGDLVLDETGTYAGMLNGNVRAATNGAYEGGVSRSGILTDTYGNYVGQIVSGGTILDSFGRYSGTVSNWADRDVE